MVKYNLAELKDKIHACWIGKNIGGTMGTPYEGTREMLDIKGFVTKEGEVLPNDDLDLQLIWLRAMEKEGPWQMSERILGEYWLAYVIPHWNEYGNSKANMKHGIYPPMSGELNNDDWKHSNGAWIRSEVWACMAPGLPNIAMKYAFMDACCDHGYAEGTYGEIFTAALESMAFTAENKDIRNLIVEALKNIPEDCRVAKAVNLVLTEYDKGTDYRVLREMLVKQSEDIGFFQAPANIAYTVLGLIYGEGDFKKSMIYAINCGDDTDCTAATVGAFLGILYGTKGIPEDWAKHIGDKIEVVAIAADYWRFCLPRSCSELTDRVMKLIIPTLKANLVDCEFGDFETKIDAQDKKAAEAEVANLFKSTKYAYGSIDFTWAKARVEFEALPIIKPGESVKFNIVVDNMKTPSPKSMYVDLLIPEGFTAEYPKNAFADRGPGYGSAKIPVVLTAGERVNAINRVVAVLECDEHMNAGLLDIKVLG